MSFLRAFPGSQAFQVIAGAGAALTLLFLVLLYSPTLQTTSGVLHLGYSTTTEQKTAVDLNDINLVTDLSIYFLDYPLNPPYKDKFGELGRRARIVRDWLNLAEKEEEPTTKALYVNAVEQVAISLFPFLEKPPAQPTSPTPVADLRASFQPGSTGIVIPTSDKTLRFAAHLVSALRSVLNSTLPIQVVYAGDRDLSQDNRALLSHLVELGPPLEFLDINSVFDNSTLELEFGGWAIKAFAALGSHFERVILADADAVFLQPPEVLLQHETFLRTGALLFHDRLLFQHAFEERHKWWKDQIRRPSRMLNMSLVWTEDYAEEQDSGLVVLDKSRLDILVGLLHVAWQNSYSVREEVTYKMTYGDKESWWLGLELSGANYEFSKHYGGIIGWEEVDERGRSKVCSFVIAHVDAHDELLWYNGGLLKNKARIDMANEYEVPSKWMIDANWQKGATKQDMSCMVGAEIKSLSNDQLRILERSIDLAKQVDAVVL
ncbi:mannosyltransferase -domain-containing protein [Penicillium odoratum]|uniref:mannosyltransferase -domain-containing protein n=1 Tax=Penicillium odoratum TaxID=1167516 RepID=UPI0025497848|nr:mannosyltransferase -domain-containing protein [Penicillium odoratum]KAJ5769066.1 mannosyltransferase -domain-containing protein [Penicillium odoratum]